MAKTTLREALGKGRFAIYRDDLGCIFVVDNTPESIIGSGYSRTVDANPNIAIKYSEDGTPYIDGIKNDWFPTLEALERDIHPYSTYPEWESVLVKK